MDYNKKSYKLILRSALDQGFGFIDFFNLNLDEHGKLIVLRHDIDFSLAMALEMAVIDASCNIKSTFALQISSPLYNPFTAFGIKTVNEIQQLGHNIVLHYRASSAAAVGEIREDVNREMQVMRAYFPYIQPVFVWHNPPSSNLLSDIEVPGLVNAYSASYVRDMHYISDSVLRHSPEDFLSSLSKHNYLYLLLHPIIWMSEKSDMVSMIASALKEVILESAKECILNPEWEKRFPYGIPEEILNKIEELLAGSKDIN